MKEALRQMMRLRQIRELRERLSEAVLARESAKVAEAARDLEEAIACRAAARAGSGSAVVVGDVAGRVLGEAMSVQAEESRMRLERWKREREAVRLNAGVVHGARRTETEQVKALEKALRSAVAVEEERRSQGVSDDRFLARALWRKRQASVKSLMQGQDSVD